MLRLLLGSAIRFDPIIVFIALGLCGVLALARWLLSWAMRD